MAILSMLPQAAFAPGILSMTQGYQPAALSRAIPPEDEAPAERPQRNFGRDYLRSQDFSTGLMRGGAALLSGQGLGGAFSSMADSMDLYRKRTTGNREMVDPSKYVEAVTDPETGEVSYEVNEDLQKAAFAEMDHRAAKPMSDYQTWQAANGNRKQDFREGAFDRTQDHKEAYDAERLALMRIYGDARVVDRMMRTGLAFGQAGADVPEGYEAPIAGEQPQGAVQAPQGRVQSYGGGIESTALSAVPGLNVTSRYRDPAHNAKVGGTANSFHTTDDARDFTPPRGMTMGQLHANLKTRFPGYDVLNEGDHVHIEPGAGMAPSARRMQGGAPRRTVRAPQVKVAPKPSAAPKAPKGVFQPTSRAEYDRLAPGTKYIHPKTGEVRIKG